MFYFFLFSFIIFVYNKQDVKKAGKILFSDIWR